MRLIDADAIRYDQLLNTGNKYKPLEWAASRVSIDATPTIEPKYAGWIPCKKKMPKPNETVNSVQKYYLVQNEFGDMMVASYNAEGDARRWGQMYQFGAIMDEIVAWMELPKEYKEGGEDEHTD